MGGGCLRRRSPRPAVLPRRGDGLPLVLQHRGMCQGRALLGDAGGEASEPGSFAEQEDGIAQVEFVELEQHLADSMSKAAPPERILISLLRKGYTLSEVAARLGVSYENAGVRVHRLRLKLREWRDGLQN